MNVFKTAMKKNIKYFLHMKNLEFALILLINVKKKIINFIPKQKYAVNHANIILFQMALEEQK